MNKKIVAWSIAGVIAFSSLMFVGSVFSMLNTEASKRVTKEAKQLDNTSEFDNLKKKINQSVQIPDAAYDKLQSIFNSYAEARTSNGSDDGSLMKWVQESIPNVDTTLYQNLMNLIVSSRDSWTMRQKELVDFDREHRLLFERQPNGFFLGLFGRKYTPIKVITSTNTEKAFESGNDDDTILFKPVQSTGIEK